MSSTRSAGCSAFPFGGPPSEVLESSLDISCCHLVPSVLDPRWADFTMYDYKGNVNNIHSARAAALLGSSSGDSLGLVGASWGRFGAHRWPVWSRLGSTVMRALLIHMTTAVSQAVLTRSS